MAALAANQVSLQFMDGQADRFAVFALRNVTTGDTADLSVWFTGLKIGALVGATLNASAVASVSGTVVTIPSGVTNDAAWLCVRGSANG